jgi:ribosome-associated protein
LTKRIHAILDEKKADHITVLDVRGISTVTDFTIIASGMSPPHIRSLYDDLQHQLKQEGVACYRRSGETEGGWMVLDYVGVIVHLFLPETRAYYALETLWDDVAAAAPPQDE